MQKVVNVIIGLVVVVIIAWVIGLAFVRALDKQAIADCHEWNAQDAEYENFWVTQWQKDQCDSVGVELTAKVSADGSDIYESE